MYVLETVFQYQSSWKFETQVAKIIYFIPFCSIVVTFATLMRLR